MKTHHISTRVQPHTKQRQLVVQTLGQNQPRQEIMSYMQYPAYHAAPHITRQDSHLAHETECEKETSRRCTRAKKGKAKEENLKSAISGTGKKAKDIL